MTIRAVFFDAGGTLIHPHPSVGEVYGGVAARLGHAAAPAEIETLLWASWEDYHRQARREGWPLPVSDAEDLEMWRRVTRTVCDGIPALRGMDFDRWFEGVYRAFSSGACWKAYPEVEEVVGICRRRGLPCGVLSNWSTNLLAILRDHGLDARMDFVLVSAREACLKPDPAFFARALEKAGVRPAEALHVGDTYRDDAAGAAACGLLGVHLDRRGRGGVGNGVPVVRDLRGILDHL
jgi:putative hydrolase of the HAD superfamily